MGIDITKIKSNAEAKGFIIDNKDISAMIMRILFCENETPYRIAGVSNGRSVSKTIDTYFSSPQMKYLSGIITPIVKTAIRSYVSENPSDFVDLFNDRSKKSEALIANEALTKLMSSDDESEMTKEELDNIIVKCLRDPKVLSSDDPQVIKLRFDMAAKYKQAKFGEDAGEQQIIILPPKNNIICPHTRKECCIEPEKQVTQ